jgi:hypothetical protein
MKKLTLFLLAAGTFAALMITWAVMGPRTAEAQSNAGPRVTIEAPLPLPVNADAAGTPFQINLCTLDFPAGCAAFPQVMTVPADKRLVIEYVSASCGTANLSGTLPFLSLLTSVGGTSAGHVFVPQAVGSTTNSKLYAVAQQTRLYADPGSSVSALASGVGSTAGCFVSFSGYLL